jgi:hypothetical protein
MNDLDKGRGSTAVGERCPVRYCNPINVYLGMVPLLRRFSSDPAWVAWTVTMSISSSCIRRARYSLFEMEIPEIPSILIWQILRFDLMDRQFRFELEFEFPLCVII